MNRAPKRGHKTEGERYRRSPSLVIHWTASGAIGLNCDTGQRTAIPHEFVPYLAHMDELTSASDLLRRQPDLGSVREVEQLLRALADRGILARERHEAFARRWADWSPEAAFFHFGTRDGRYPPDVASGAYDAKLRAKAKRVPQPAPTKAIHGQAVPLPAAELSGSLGEALRTRRTWRQFSEQPLDLARLSTLLQQTFGVQRWGLVRGQGHVALKTSPSGGARHSIEAYVIALNVRGLRRSVFHYNAASHELVGVGTRMMAKRLAVAIAYQHFFLEAAALVVMTAVFERAMWRYPYSRAYRSILTEAGHLGQTFCLAATALELAPFCTMAFRETELEQMLGVDGVAESAMYVVGVGNRPRRVIQQPGKILSRSGHGAK